MRRLSKNKAHGQSHQASGTALPRFAGTRANAQQLANFWGVTAMSATLTPWQKLTAEVATLEVLQERILTERTRIVLLEDRVIDALTMDATDSERLEAVLLIIREEREHRRNRP